MRPYYRLNREFKLYNEITCYMTSCGKPSTHVVHKYDLILYKGWAPKVYGSCKKHAHELTKTISEYQIVGFLPR